MKKSILAFVSLMMTVICFLQCAMPCFAVERPKLDEVATAESLYVDTGNKEADAIMNNFIDKAMFLPKKEYFKVGLGNVSKNSRYVLSCHFMKLCGAEQEQYDRLCHDNDLETYLWAECYVLICFWAFHHPEYFESWETLYLTAWGKVEKYIGNELVLLVNVDEPEDEQTAAWIEAYNAVLRYQYDYFKANGTIYCFFTGQPWKVADKNDYSAYWGGVINNSDVTTMYIPSGYLNETTPTVANTVLTDEQQTGSIDSASVTEAVTTTKAADNVGKRVLSKLASTWLTLSIIFVLLVVLGVIIITKKRKGK